MKLVVREATSVESPAEMHTVVEDHAGRILAARLKSVFEFIEMQTNSEPGRVFAVFCCHMQIVNVIMRLLISKNRRKLRCHVGQIQIIRQKTGEIFSCRLVGFCAFFCWLRFQKPNGFP
jgi:hypothetical protein